MPSNRAGAPGCSTCPDHGCCRRGRQCPTAICASTCAATCFDTRYATVCPGRRSASASTRECTASPTPTTATSGTIFKIACRRCRRGARTSEMTSLEPGFERLNVVALFFWGRSGSVYLHSLFDSHPEVLTFPASRLNGFHGWQWQRISRERNAAAMARCFIECNPSVFDGRQDRWFEGLDALGPSRDAALSVDTQAFTRELVRLVAGGEPTRRRFFLA